MKRRQWIILLFVVGAGILIFPHVAEKINSSIQGKQASEFRQSVTKKSKDEIEEELDKAAMCNEEIYYNGEGLHDPFEDSHEKLNLFKDCLGIQDDEIFSAIEIPKLGLMIPIYLGSSDAILNKGVGQVEGSSLPLGGESTHSVLAAHRGMGTKAMFRNVDELHAGDVFFIHGNTGTLEYRVTEQRVIYPHETSSLEIEEDRDLVTLLTCHPYRYNYQRLLIHAERVM